MKAQVILEKFNYYHCSDNRSLGMDEVVKFYVVESGGQPRWIIPALSRCAIGVLSQWQPYNISSRLKWGVVKTFYSLRLMSLLPNVSTIIVKNSDFFMPGSHQTLIPVIYVGTPGPQRKAVATLVNPKNKCLVSVMKVALSAIAIQSLLQEADMLKFLKSRFISNVPILIHANEKMGTTWQTIVQGKLSESNLQKMHVDWLAKVPISHSTTTIDEYRGKLLDFLFLNDYFTQEEKIVVRTEIENLRGTSSIALLLVHGDFAPWNLKPQVHGELGVIDWEDAVQEGFPLWDLCHFHYVQAYLFGDNTHIEQLLSSQLIDEYLSGFGYDLSCKYSFVSIYIFGTLLDPKFRISPEYKSFLLKQVALVKCP
jgi:hypothetical protein